MKKIFATDFDGVICDGLTEYFHSSKLAYEQIWQESIDIDKVKVIQPQFNILRPVIETGWEMPVLLRALVTNKSTEEILTNWHKICHEIVREENLDIKLIAHTLDQIRQNQINNDLSAWLKLHNFYQGVIPLINKLVNSGCKFYIITTKEGSFVKKLLEKQNIILYEQYIIGKEQKRPKYETLRLIMEKEQVKPEQMYFFEDRLEALKLVAQQPYLKGVHLFLADWGYNTEQTRANVEFEPTIKLISKSEFICIGEKLNK